MLVGFLTKAVAGISNDVGLKMGRATIGSLIATVHRRRAADRMAAQPMTNPPSAITVSPVT